VAGAIDGLARERAIHEGSGAIRRRDGLDAAAHLPYAGSMRPSIPWLVAVGSCVSACQGALDLERYSFEPLAAGAGGSAGSGSGGLPGGGGNAGASNAGGASGTGGSAPGGGAGGSGVPPEPEQAVAVFDHYRFARDAVTFSVGFEAGLLRNDPGALTAVAGVVTTERGGNVDVAADGGFIYTPAVEAWGDDFFEYTLAESQSSARVRLTLTPGTVPLGDVAGNTDNGFVILGESANAELGGVVAGGGDVNGDGSADLLVSVNGGGNAYVVFGKGEPAPIPTLDLALGASAAGFAIVPSASFPQAGYSLANAGDVNGDGLDDILVGTASFNTNGSAYVVFGKTTTETVDLGALDAGSGGGFAIVGAATGDAVGLSVSGAGDVNGDGRADLIVGASGTDDGTAYVVFGKATPEPFSLGLLNGGLDGGFAITGPPDPDGAIASSAGSVAGLGDVNGDGLSDVAFNARQAATSIAYVVFGKRDTAPLSVTALGSAGFTIDDAASPDVDGMLVSGAGDVNGDGLADLLLGEDDADPSLAGAAYVVFGKADALPVDFAALKAGMRGGFVIQGGDDFDNAGRTVSAAGDFDADGFADLLVGAENAAPGGGASKGKAYLVWGTPGSATVQLSDVESEIGGITIEGAFEQDFAGSGVANAGDVDRDGMLDLLLGARGADAVADAAGVAHVLFGWDAREALRARERALVGTGADDVLPFDGTALISVAGGNGTDSLAFDGAGLSLDLRERALRVESIEVVDVRGSGDNTLWLDDAAVRRLPQTRAGLPGGLAKTLVVLADVGDSIYFDTTSYAVIGSNAGRDVYQKTGALYGLEVSPGVSLAPPPP
jgi:hypothetical protein